MALNITLQELTQLAAQAAALSNRILFHLQNSASPTSPELSQETIDANYRALSQIFDDLVRLSLTTNQINDSLNKPPETT